MDSCYPSQAHGLFHVMEEYPEIISPRIPNHDDVLDGTLNAITRVVLFKPLHRMHIASMTARAMPTFEDDFDVLAEQKRIRRKAFLAMHQCVNARISERFPNIDTHPPKVTITHHDSL